MSRRGPLRNRAESALLTTVLGGFQWSPRIASDLAGRMLARLAYHLLGSRRKTAMRNLSLVYNDEITPERRREITRGTFDTLGRHLVEFARLPRLRADSLDQVCHHEGWSRFIEAKARGRGVLILAAHFGAWELIPYAQALRGEPMSFVVRPADNERVERFIRARREAHGNRVIEKESAVRACLRALRERRTVGILIDQRVPSDWGVDTTFLGQSVYTTPIVAALALRTGAPVLPAFAVHEGDGTNRIILGPEIELVRTGDYRKDVQSNTQRFVDVVERFVRQHPEQWLWIHRRFRGRDADVVAGRPGNQD